MRSADRSRSVSAARFELPFFKAVRANAGSSGSDFSLQKRSRRRLEKLLHAKDQRSVQAPIRGAATSIWLRKEQQLVTGGDSQFVPFETNVSGISTKQSHIFAQKNAEFCADNEWYRNSASPAPL
jgi:hypothetical protein